MRRKVKNRNIVSPDFVYNSQKLEKFINYVMWSGKKETSRKIMYKAFDVIKEKTGNPNPLEIFDLAMKNAGPLTEVRSKRIGGANYQVPREVRPERRLALAMRWIRDAARKTKGRPMHLKLADELIAASKNEGAAIKKRDDTHKMAEANKAFAHFAWQIYNIFIWRNFLKEQPIPKKKVILFFKDEHIKSIFEDFKKDHGLSSNFYEFFKVLDESKDSDEKEEITKIILNILKMNMRGYEERIIFLFKDKNFRIKKEDEDIAAKQLFDFFKDNFKSLKQKQRTFLVCKNSIYIIQFRKRIRRFFIN